VINVNKQQEPAGVAIDGPEVRRWRKRLGWTVTGLAARCHISQQYLSLIERGDRRTVGPPVFARICDAFGLDVESRSELMRKEEAA
jgi:transcriptional regulator with XRE-family HTH domain